MRYGFIGLGSLGAHLAVNLARGGFQLEVFDLQRCAAEAVLAAGAHWADSVAELAQLSDCLITCLPSPAATAEVLTQALPALRPGSTWIEMSTNDFAEIEAPGGDGHGAGHFHPRLPRHRRRASGRSRRHHGFGWRCARVFTPSTSRRSRPWAGRIIYLGGIEQAAVTKVVTNMLAFIHLIAAGEALMLCAKAGVDLSAAFDAIAASSGNSFVHETESQVILNGSYDIGFTMDLACKDAGFALEYGRRFGVPLRLAGLMQQIFIEGRTKYGGGAFSSMIVKLLEDAVGTPLRAPGFPSRLGADP